MLDYDDFNARHKLEFLAMVIECAVEHCGYDEALGAKLAHSLMNGLLYAGGKLVGEITGTMMSGHRGTTFFNTILNEAYLRYAFPGLTSQRSMHIGDDVYIAVDSYTTAGRIMQACKESNLAMNELKQSMGDHCAEFLRVAYGKNFSMGYVCRSIGACVCGNWVGEVSLGAEEALKSMVGHGWTMCNRCQNLTVSLILVLSVQRVTGLKARVCAYLLTGKWALNAGPCRASREYYKSVKVSFSGSTRKRQIGEKIRHYSKHATEDYLTNCLEPVETLYLEECGGVSNIVSKMAEASYAKTVVGMSTKEDPLDAEVVSTRGYSIDIRAMTAVAVSSLHWEEKNDALLSRYPILMLVQNEINRDLELLESLLLYVDANTSGLGPRELMQLAWGEKATPIGVLGFMTHSDAAAACKVTYKDLLDSSDYHDCA